MNETTLDDEKALKQKKAEELDNSVLFDVHRSSDFPPVNHAVDALLDELNADPKFLGKDNLKKKHIKVIILDLYATWLADSTCYVAYSRHKPSYRSKSRYNKLHISFKTVGIVDALLSKGYVTHYKGFYNRSGGSPSRMSRMRATPKLIKLITNTYGITEEMVDVYRHRECIRLREYDEGKKGQVDVHIYDDTPAIRRMRTELYAYNNLLRRTFIDVPHFPIEGIITGSKKTRKGKDKTPIRIDRTDKFVERIFSNKRWDNGGRYYRGWWQRLPKKWRERIRINDEPVVELDYSGLHIVMLYALEGIDYWKEIKEDPYKLGKGADPPENMRDLLKIILLTIINAKSPETAIKAVRWDVNKHPDEFGWVKDEDLKLEEIVERFQEHHEPIAHHFSSGKGISLQNSDSRMAELVIKEFTTRGIPILCVHDSFVVQKRHEDLLRKTMEEAWAKIEKAIADGLESDTKIKGSELAKKLLKRTRKTLNLSKGRKTRTSETGKEMQISRSVMDEINRLRKTSRKVIYTLPEPISQRYSDKLRMFIEEQNYLEELEFKDERYVRRWEDHRNREWEEVYFREED